MVSMLIELQTCVLRMMLTPGDLVFRDNIYSRQQLLSTLLSWINSETQGVPFEFQPVHQPYQMLHKDQETATESVPSEVEELKQRVRQNKLALWTNKQLAKDLSVKSFRSRKAKLLLMTPSPNT
jgi:pyruvate-formate lyase-activating enzyme